jgi:hypothetical protein
MLRPDTELVWSFLREQPALARFVLVGGSALALHLKHRLSEDLDLIFPDRRLPRARLDAFRHAAAAAGHDFRPHDDPVALADFNDSTLDLLDYQQDFLVNDAVRVSFFTADQATQAVLEKTAANRGPRVASVGELFRTKALVSARRSRTRDWFDLYVLMTQHGFTMTDYHAAFAAARLEGQAGIGLQRLCAGQPHAADPGFEQLAPDAPSVAIMQEFFRQQRDAFERKTAAQAWLNKDKPE